MGGNTYGYQEMDSAGRYWRRRFVVLVVGLVTFGVAAWGLSSLLAVSPHVPAGGPSAGVSHRTGGKGRGRPTPRPSGQSGDRPSAKNKSRSQPAAGATSSARDVASSARGQGSAGTAGLAAGRGTILPAFCGRRDIVLSLYTGQAQFGPRQLPAFDLNIVSTQQAECSFNVGSRHLVLVIREGPERIWSSADCAAGASDLVAALKRGVPTVLAVNWDRRTSAPGCSGRAVPVPAGVYTAYAVDGNLTSAPVTFHLG